MKVKEVIREIDAAHDGAKFLYNMAQEEKDERKSDMLGSLSDMLTNYISLLEDLGVPKS